ncbi:MAG: hypothetical protein ACQESF_00830 [Nanobdellota archaeon]
MDIEEFINRMEENYECSENFKNSIRLTLQKIQDMDVSHSTKLALLQKAEDTYLRHSRNYSQFNEIVSDINKNNEELSENLGSKENSNDFIDLD